MKVRDRTGAGNQRSSGPAQHAGERLPAPVRERKPALAALAVLLILVGALGATVLVLRAGDRIKVVRLSADVPAGKAVTDDSMTSVMVADDPGIHYVPWSQKNELKKLRAKSTLVAGTIPIGEMFSDDMGLPDGKAFVGLALKEGQYPAGIKTGDEVSAYRVGADSDKDAAGANALIVRSAKVSDVVRGDNSLVGSGSLPVTLLVSSSDVEGLTQAAATGQVALVLVPSPTS
ncbi:hypothetical protein OG338_17480 [Streptomyces sp. NBC_00726]|uniref:hypothetical protein n=1 Tax=Streptomyces sp. NBC_00726 TaxID=2903674 RepID=UPI003867A095